MFKLERREGHFVGAVGINTIVTFGTILIGLGVALLLAGSDTGPGLVVLILGGVALFVSAFFFPISKTLWSAIDLIMIPIEPGEVDPRFDPSVGTSDDKKKR